MWKVSWNDKGNWIELNVYDNIEDATELFNSIVASGNEASIDYI